MPLEKIISLILPLLGVIIGGLITFFIQQNSTKKAHAFEREKIRQDNLNKDETEKLKAYNKLLLNNGNHKIWVFERHGGGELDYSMYVNYARPVLFEVFHLLDEKVINELNYIEETFDKQEFDGEETEGDRKALSDSYLKIIEVIKQEFQNHREAKKSLKSA